MKRRKEDVRFEIINVNGFERKSFDSASSEIGHCNDLIGTDFELFYFKRFRV